MKNGQAVQCSKSETYFETCTLSGENSPSAARADLQTGHRAGDAQVAGRRLVHLREAHTAGHHLRRVLQRTKAVND